MSLAARAALGLPADPWARARADTADERRVQEAVAAALAGALVSVSGPRGAGKTSAARRALAGRTAVQPLRLDRERLTLPDVLSAIVAQMSGESPRHSGEARAAQARRLLAGRRAVVVVDDAHLLHGQTVRGLRRLRELPWSGEGPLCGVLLLGQRDRTAAVDEVALRSERIVLAGLAPSEASAGLRQAYGAVLSDAAREALAAAADGATWLDARAAAEAAVEAAAARGGRRVEIDDVAPPAAVPPAPPDDAAVAAAIARRRAAA